MLMYNELHSIYPFLYGSLYNTEEMDNRFSSLIEEHNSLFHKNTPALFSSPGRTEISGNHTDHNLGLVIGAAINLDTIAAVSKRDDNKVIFASKGFPLISLDITNKEIREEEKNTTASLIRGIAHAFTLGGVVVGGWEANIQSNVLVGSGLSSSASIEVLIAEIFNNLYNNDAFSPLELARIAQYAENVYFGKPSGLLDQASCALGGVVALDFKDKDNPVVEPMKLNLREYELTMVITNTHGCHANLTGEYSAIPNEMRQVAAYFGKKNLRDVDFDDFISSLKPLRNSIKNDRAILRAYHYFTENDRVRYMISEIKDGDIDTFLYNVNESGTSSFCFLQNVFPSTNPTEQKISLAIMLSQKILQGEGAVRVHGGGFAGTIQAYVPDHLLKRYVSAMDSLFGEGSTLLVALREKEVCRLI